MMRTGWLDSDCWKACAVPGEAPLHAGREPDLRLGLLHRLDRVAERLPRARLKEMVTEGN